MRDLASFGALRTRQCAIAFGLRGRNTLLRVHQLPAQFDHERRLGSTLT
jgi:hypothetical protein